MDIKVKEQKGETSIQCNNTMQAKDVELMYPSASGEYRTVQMNNSIPNMKDIKFKEIITIPTINHEGEKEFINVESLEEKSFNSTNVKV